MPVRNETLDFFDQVDESEIVENHINSVLKLEETQARALLSKYREIRGDLRDRLDSVKSGTFTAQQIRGVLAQVDAAIIAMNSSLKDGIVEGAEKSALRGVEDLLSEIRKFSQMFGGAVTPINLNVALVAQDAANFRINQYESSLDAYSEQLRSQITTQIANASLEQITMNELTGRMSKFFLGEEWKLTQIARTELHGVYNLGKMASMEEVQENYLSDLKKTLIHPMDGRTGADSKALARQNPIVDIDKPFIQKWNGKTYTFMAPPNRPNDRAILVPYRKAWDE